MPSPVNHQGCLLVFIALRSFARYPTSGVLSWVAHIVPLVLGVAITALLGLKTLPYTGRPIFVWYDPDPGNFCAYQGDSLLSGWAYYGYSLIVAASLFLLTHIIIRVSCVCQLELTVGYLQL